MQGELYFETDPWQYAAEIAGKGELGRIAAISVQCSCENDSMTDMESIWLDRVEKLVGKPVRADVIQNRYAESILLRCENNIIARIFISADSKGANTGAANAEGTNNREYPADFEILGTDSLLVWRPYSRILSFIKTLETQHVIFEHSHADFLTEEDMT